MSCGLAFIVHRHFFHFKHNGSPHLVGGRKVPVQTQQLAAAAGLQQRTISNTTTGRRQLSAPENHFKHNNWPRQLSAPENHFKHNNWPRQLSATENHFKHNNWPRQLSATENHFKHNNWPRQLSAGPVQTQQLTVVNKVRPRFSK